MAADEAELLVVGRKVVASVVERTWEWPPSMPNQWICGEMVCVCVCVWMRGRES